MGSWWHLSLSRTVIGCLTIEYGKETLTDFAGYVGWDVSTLSNAVREYRTRLGKDRDLQKIIQGFSRGLWVKRDNDNKY